tara:strand:+ start:1549 stop:2313 length:765 start_codon:yes stop_codon:yes gene_type:complete
MIGCIIQARMGSNRLPGKVMELLDEKNPSLYYTVSQIRNVKKLDKIIVATTNTKEDDIIFDFTKKMNIECFRGNEDDVLDRYYQCAKEYDLDIIIRITADCPLIDPQIVNKALNEFEIGKIDYIQNLDPRTFPDGMDIEIFTFNILKEAWKNADLSSEREHVTPYFRNNEKKFNIKNFSHDKDLSHYRWTLDYHEDLELIKIIVNDIIQRPILMKDVLSLFEKNPKLFEINKKYDANEGYKLSLEKDKKGNLDQ